MKKIVLLVLLALVISCAPVTVPPAAAPAPLPAATAGSPTAATAKQGKLRINLSSDIRISNIPTRMALDALTEQGYQVEAIPIAQFNLVIPALIQGDLDISTGSNLTIWSAIAKGGKIRSIVGWTNNPYYLVASSNIKHCGELDGKPIGMLSFRGLIEAELEDYLVKNCKNAQPEYLSIDSNEPRRAALESGQIVGGRFELDDVLQLEEEASGKFAPLINFGTEYPEVSIASFVAGQDFIDKNPGLVKDFVLELLKAQRQIQDPEILKEQIIKYYQLDADTAAAQANAYLEANLWDVNGGLTQESIEKTMDFIVQNKMLAAALKPEEVADISFLNAALDEIGRK